MRRAFSVMSMLALAVAAVLATATFVSRGRFSTEATLAIADTAPSAEAAVPAVAGLSHSYNAAIEATPVPATRLLRVRSVADTPEAAAIAANDVVHAYVRQADEDASRATRRELDAVQAGQARVRDAIDALDAQLASLRAGSAPLMVVTRRTAHESARTTSLIAAKASAYRQVVGATSLDAVPVIAQDPLVAALTSRLAELEALRAEYVTGQAGADRMAAVDLTISRARQERWTAQQRLAHDIRADYEALASRGQVVRQQMASFQASLQASQARLAAASQLVADIDAERARLAELQARARQLTAALAATDSGARVVTSAVVPDAAAGTSRAFAALLVVGVCFAASRIRLAPRSRVLRPSSAYANFRVARPRTVPTPRRRRAA